MIQASSATKYIADELDKLKQSGQLNGKLTRSVSSISIYLRSKDPNNPPSKYFRSSDHHPTHRNLLHNNWKPWNSINISIEFAETRYNANGKRLVNKWNDTVKQDAKGTVQPFSIDVYEYKASMLEDSDIPTIFSAIKTFALTGTYTDPFAGTPQAAKHTRRPAKIKPFKRGTASANTATSNTVKTTSSANTSPSAKTMTESTKKERGNKPIKVTRDELVSIVKDCVEKFLFRRKVKKFIGHPVQRNGYRDNSKWGWKWQEKYYRENGYSEKKIEDIRKLYDEYGRECAEKGIIANGLGFDMWDWKNMFKDSAQAQ